MAVFAAGVLWSLSGVFIVLLSLNALAALRDEIERVTTALLGGYRGLGGDQ